MAKTKRKRREGQKIAAQEPRDVSLGRWDQGADGPANRRGLVVEPRGDVDADTGQVRNPNGVRGVRRVDNLEFWHRRGTISTAGFNAAEKLRDAYEQTLRGQAWPEAERVQSTSKPDKAVAVQVDRIAAFTALAKHIAPSDRAIVDACVLHGGTPADAGYRREHYTAGLVALREALDRLARNAK